MAKSSTSFVKGDSRINRKGRPKNGETLAEKFRDALQERLDENTGYSQVDSIIDAQIKKALKGDLSAADWLFARGWGKVPDRIQLTQPPAMDLSKLSLEEKLVMEEMLKKVSPDEENPA